MDHIQIRHFMKSKRGSDMTNEQIEQAQQMHTEGISWQIIASYFGVSQSTLLKHRKHYGATCIGLQLTYII